MTGGAGGKLHADLSLAVRLELAEARGALDYVRALGRVDPTSDPRVLEVAGTWAVWAGHGSPFNRVVGLGMAGPVAARDLDAVEALLLRRDGRSVVDLCPLAHPSLTDLLGARGYRPLEFMNVWYLPLGPGPEPVAPGPFEIRPVTAGEESLWILTVTRGFLGRDDVSEGDLRVSRPFPFSSATCYLARSGGEPAGGAAMLVQGRLATLFGDGTRRSFRRRGLQAALIGARLEAARDMGCDLVTAQAVPGSSSGRNIERGRFRLAYTKVIAVRG